MTRGDKFRSMTDEEIVDAAFDAVIGDYVDFCKSRPECDNHDGIIPDEWCKKCMLEWLQEDVPCERYMSWRRDIGGNEND